MGAKGKSKTPGSGRKAGTPNKPTTDLHEIAEELGIHPFKLLLYYADGRWKDLNYNSETITRYSTTGMPFEEYVIKPEVRMKAAASAAEYLYPKRKQLEILAESEDIPKADPHRTFQEFCQKAGYPNAYPKQIEMMKFGMDQEPARLLLGSRGYGKTDYVVILGIAYKLCKDPSFTVLLITKSEQRNTAILEEIAKAAISNGLNFQKQNAECLRVVGLQGKEESVSAVTVGSTAIRGRHPDMVVMDDPVTPEDTGEATRLKVQRVYNEVNKLCKNILIIGQPVHKFDLYETLRPMLLKLEVPHGSIPELDHDLEAQRLAGVDEASIQASYFLNVKSSDGSPFDKVKYVDKFPVGGTSVAFIDPSDGGNDTAVSIFRMLGHALFVVGFSWKKSWHHCFPELSAAFKRFGVAKICFETNKHGLQPLDVLRTELKPLGIGVDGRFSNNNKHSRIMAAGTFANLIHLSKESDKNYIDRVVKYELGSKNDDAPDSLATGMEWIGLIKGKQ